MLGAHIFKIVISSSWIDPLIIMYHLSLSLVTIFILKSVLSDICYSSFLLLSICIEYFFPMLSLAVCRCSEI